VGQWLELVLGQKLELNEELELVELATSAMNPTIAMRATTPKLIAKMIHPTRP